MIRYCLGLISLLIANPAVARSSLAEIIRTRDSETFKLSRQLELTQNFDRELCNLELKNGLVPIDCGGSMAPFNKRCLEMKVEFVGRPYLQRLMRDQDLKPECRNHVKNLLLKARYIDGEDPVFGPDIEMPHENYEKKQTLAGDASLLKLRTRRSDWSGRTGLRLSRAKIRRRVAAETDRRD